MTLYGLLYSNWFGVKNIKEFIDWFYNNLYYCQNMHICYINDKGKNKRINEGHIIPEISGKVSFGIRLDEIEEFPKKVVPKHYEKGEKIYNPLEEWTYGELADSIRYHLLEDEVFHVIIFGTNARNYYCGFTELKISQDEIKFKRINSVDKNSADWFFD